MHGPGEEDAPDRVEQPGWWWGFWRLLEPVEQHLQHLLRQVHLPLREAGQELQKRPGKKRVGMVVVSDQAYV